MDRLDPRIRSKLEAIQAEAQRSYFRRNRIKMSVEALEAFGYFQARTERPQTGKKAVAS